MSQCSILWLQLTLCVRRVSRVRGENSAQTSCLAVEQHTYILVICLKYKICTYTLFMSIHIYIIYIYIYIHIYVTCSNEIGCLSKKYKIELVTPLERICINLSNGAKITDISHTQPKLLDPEHA